MSDKTESISDKLRCFAEKDGDKIPLDAALMEFGIEETDSWDDLREVFRRIADEIDAEKREITERYARQSWMNPADAIAKLATGEIEWPELKEAIDRYYIPRPLFEDGEPVQFGEMTAHPILGKPSPIKSIEYFGDGSFALWFDGTEAITGYDSGERVRRPKPQVLDADGVPIEVGDTVWWKSWSGRWKKRTVSRIGQIPELVRESYPDVASAVYFNDMDWMPNNRITHREPDSQERIDRDALKNEYLYWGCTGSECLNCPALIDGKRPKEFYGVDWCKNATRIDLLRRQRELDGRDA